jgi:hypothetical protein
VWEIKVYTRQRLGGITLWISVSEIQESHFPGEEKVETFRDLENLPSQG